ncbi:MAG: hypothetical protein A2289_00110 [Deltaproteobacteria bacterium RIFOXYA12_FULL_58_15]|nr:MAG: hypothetical protein A2289_00110 [Deltaproteobacteria bacterium RIFOXYA12_FULL_58_15]OGR08915.1 MAG: hypothetical protein A2341_27825 [Deltaproteobacteria bacterium RIFOXYB12_FULL_58_9]
MNYVALVGEQKRQVELTELEDGKFRVVIDGRELFVDARAVADTTLSLMIDGQVYNIESELDPAGHGENFSIRGEVVNVEVLDLRSMQLRQAKTLTGGVDGPAEIAAPMPGKIVAILVEEGQQVEEGQGLVVVEAMKMENELKSPRAGVVKNLTAQKDATVESGLVLCVIE